MSLFGDAKRLAYGAREEARGSFDEVVLAIETTPGGKLPKRQAAELAAKVSPTLRNALIPVIPIDSPRSRISL